MAEPVDYQSPTPRVLPDGNASNWVKAVSAAVREYVNPEDALIERKGDDWKWSKTPRARLSRHLYMPTYERGEEMIKAYNDYPETNTRILNLGAWERPYARINDPNTSIQSRDAAPEALVRLLVEPGRRSGWDSDVFYDEKTHTLFWTDVTIDAAVRNAAKQSSKEGVLAELAKGIIPSNYDEKQRQEIMRDLEKKVAQKLAQSGFKWFSGVASTTLPAPDPEAESTPVTSEEKRIKEKVAGIMANFPEWERQALLNDGLRNTSLSAKHVGMLIDAGVDPELARWNVDIAPNKDAIKAYKEGYYSPLTRLPSHAPASQSGTPQPTHAVSVPLLPKEKKPPLINGVESFSDTGAANMERQLADLKWAKEQNRADAVWRRDQAHYKPQLLTNGSNPAPSHNYNGTRHNSTYNNSTSWTDSRTRDTTEAFERLRANSLARASSGLTGVTHNGFSEPASASRMTRKQSEPLIPAYRTGVHTKTHEVRSAGATGQTARRSLFQRQPDSESHSAGASLPRYVTSTTHMPPAADTDHPTQGNTKPSFTPRKEQNGLLGLLTAGVTWLLGLIGLKADYAFTSRLDGLPRTDNGHEVKSPHDGQQAMLTGHGLPAVVHKEQKQFNSPLL